MIMCVSVHQKFVLDKILAFGTIDGRPGDMELDLASKLYYKQYDLEYEVRGNGDTVHKADRLKLNLYFNPVRRAEELVGRRQDGEAVHLVRGTDHQLLCQTHLEINGVEGQARFHAGCS